MAIQPMALAVANPEMNALGSFAEGQQQAQRTQMNNMAMAQQAMKNIGSLAFGVMGGKLDGAPDPQRWEEALDMLAGQGMNVDGFRGRADLAPVIAKASVDTLGQLNLAQNERELEQRIKEFGFRVSEAAKGKDETYFGTGIPIKNADGTISYGQFGSKGSFNVPDLPEGAEFLTPVQQLNTGTAFTGVDKFGNQTGNSTPIDNFGAAQDTSMGKVIGEAAAQKILDLPKVISTSDNMLGTIEGILSDPALDTSTGWLAWMQGVPGTDQYRFGQRALQLQGQSFLQAFESLKGAGQITEVEGSKATQAIGRLSTAQNPADYRDALKELNDIIKSAKQRAINTAESVALPSNAAIKPNTQGGAQSGGALPDGVTEEDIQYTMQVNGLTREEVMKRLGYAP